MKKLTGKSKKFPLSRRPGTGGMDRELSPLVKAVLWRRSFRVYDGHPVSDEILDRIEATASQVPSFLGAKSGWVELVRDPSQVQDVVLAATGGLVGKGNWWLRSARPAAFLIAKGDEAQSLRVGDRWMYNVDAALAGQAAVLAAAEAGVGSCWMAAIDENKLRVRLGLPSNRRIPAVISLGYPRATGARNLAGMWDRLAHRLVSSRRKHPDEIHFLEEVDSGAKLPPVRLDGSVIGVQKKSIVDLVADLNPSSVVTGDPLDDTRLAWLLEFLRQAPTADNSQIWRILFVRDPARIQGIITAARQGREDLAALSQSRPSALVVVAATKFFISHRTAEQPFFLIDVPIGLMHILLAARHFQLTYNVVLDFNYQAVADRTGFGDHRMVALLLLGTKGRQGESEPWVQLRRV